MDSETLKAIGEKVQEAVSAAVDDKAEELEGRLQDTLEGFVSDVISEALSEGIEDYLSGHGLTLPDGSVLTAKQKTRVMTPDKKRVLVCYGGMRVDGKALSIQTRISCWETLWNYESEEKAVEALQKVNAAIEQGLSLVEL